MCHMAAVICLSKILVRVSVTQGPVDQDTEGIVSGATNLTELGRRWSERLQHTGFNLWWSPGDFSTLRSIQDRRDAL